MCENAFFTSEMDAIMKITIIISLVMIVALVASILLKPNVSVKKITIGTYWVVALLGAIALVMTGCITLSDIGSGLVAQSSINPLKILVLFLSMTVQSVFLDEAGLFRYCAGETLKRACGSQRALFLYLYLIVSVLTVFTSNDIIILTFTPFICYFCKNANINPIPYLFTEFVAANTWSMALIIGNPTNVYLATATGITFLDYVSVMILPTIAGGLMALGILYLIFHKQLNMPMNVTREDVKIEDKGLLGIGVTHLSLCTILLVVSSYIGLEMWFITFCFALSLFTISAIYCLISHKALDILKVSLKRLPWELIPFVISMFVFVLAFNREGITVEISDLFGERNVVLKYGISSFLAANLVNNIPMSVLFSSIAQGLNPENIRGGIFAAVIGSNIGAFFTPIGALAGIMWSGILKKQHVRFNFSTYIKYGMMVSVPTLLATILCLTLVNP